MRTALDLKGGQKRDKDWKTHHLELKIKFKYVVMVTWFRLQLKSNWLNENFLEICGVKC